MDAKTYKITVGGEGSNREATLTLDDLKTTTAYEVVAVNQCSGNRRGLSNPSVAASGTYQDGPTAWSVLRPCDPAYPVGSYDQNEPN